MLVYKSSILLLCVAHAISKGHTFSLFPCIAVSFVLPSPQSRISTRPLQSRRARNPAVHRTLPFRIFNASLDPSALRVCEQTLHFAVLRLRRTRLKMVLYSCLFFVPRIPICAQVDPVWIHGFYQFNLFASRPPFYLLFTTNGISNIVRGLKIN